MRRIHSPSSMVSPDMVSPLLRGYGTEMMFLTQRLMDVVTKKADVCESVVVSTKLSVTMSTVKHCVFVCVLCKFESIHNNNVTDFLQCVSVFE